MRYLPLIPRLQRLYASEASGEHMTWHANHQTEDGSMCHMSDAEAWRHFDQTYPNFVVEPRNVRLDHSIRNVSSIYLESLIEELQNL
ncbi:UNVERIFIED_CONTAM: hypothetical protein Scaly_2435100, partial [Sesamum calycinum]